MALRPDRAMEPWPNAIAPSVAAVAGDAIASAVTIQPGRGGGRDGVYGQRGAERGAFLRVVHPAGAPEGRRIRMLASVPFLFLPAAPGVVAFMAADASSGAIGYLSGTPIGQWNG